MCDPEDQSTMDSCTSVGGAPGECPGASRYRCHTPSFPSEWLLWNPLHCAAGRLTTCWGSEEKHLPAGMRKKRRSCPQGGVRGRAGAPGRAFSSVCLVPSAPTVDVFLGYGPAVVRKP